MALYKRGKNWFIDYRYPSGRQGKRIREKIGPVTKDEATIVLSTRLKDILVGRNPELRRIKPILFADHAREVLDKHYASMRSYSWAKTVIEATLIPFFGDTLLMSVNEKLVMEYRVKRGKDGVKPTTINGERAVLSGIMSWAIKWERLHENPVKAVEEVEELERKPTFLTYDQADNLIACAANHLKPIIITALETGGRRGEVLGLDWKHINMSRGAVCFTGTKSGKDREVPMTPALEAALGGLAVGKVRSISGRVFLRGGKDLKSVRTAFGKARGRAGLGKEVTFHTLRHTFASWYVMRGGDLYRLQKLLGHADIKTTMIYAHMTPDHLKAAVPLMGRQSDTPQAIGGHSVDNPVVARVGA